jgi:hypothetical protein
LYPKICYPRVSLNYPRFFIQIGANKCPNKQLFGRNNAPLLSTVLVFAGLFKKANNEGHLYLSHIGLKKLFKDSLEKKVIDTFL